MAAGAGPALGEKTACATPPPPSPTVLYEDEWCVVDDEGLLIRAYYFPTASARRVRWARLARVDADPRGGALASTKRWGMALDLDVWWAADATRFARDARQLLVAAERREDGGDAIRWPRKGFTCAEPERALEAIRATLAKQHRCADASGLAKSQGETPFVS